MAQAYLNEIASNNRGASSANSDYSTVRSRGSVSRRVVKLPKLDLRKFGGDLKDPGRKRRFSFNRQND